MASLHHKLTFVNVDCSKAADWDVQAGFTEAQTETLAPAWGDTFHLCVAEASQILKVYLTDDCLSGTTNTETHWKGCLANAG